MEDEINLLDYWRIIVKWKRTIAAIVLAITFSSVLISIILPKTYKAKATIMPIGGQKVGGLASLAAASLGGLGGLLGAVGGTSSTSAQILAILKSRTMAEKIIDKYGLMKVFYEKLWDRGNQRWKTNDPKDLPQMEAVVNLFSSIVFFGEDKKSQLITISAEMKDPELAAQVVNGCLEELADFLNRNAFTSAKRNRIFIEGQLERNKADLLESGKELAAFYVTNKISNVVPTVDVDVSMGEGVDVPSALAEAQKKTKELQKQVEGVKVEIEKAKVVQGIPQQVYLQYLTLRRELLGEVNALLTQQYEMAKIEEAKEDLNFQVIDWARVPVKRFKPRRRQIVMTAFVMSFFLAVFYAFFREYLEKMKEGSKFKGER